MPYNDMTLNYKYEVDWAVLYLDFWLTSIVLSILTGLIWPQYIRVPFPHVLTSIYYFPVVAIVYFCCIFCICSYVVVATLDNVLQLPSSLSIQTLCKCFLH